jgi:hypothetical protein
MHLGKQTHDSLAVWEERVGGETQTIRHIYIESIISMLMVSDDAVLAVTGAT